MSLKGSLQTVALPEVLNFLSSTGKTGEFQVSGTEGEGRLWFVDGRISGFAAGQAQEPFEAVFELMRIADGEFTFAAENARPEEVAGVSGDAGEVGPAIEAAEARLGEWREIVEVVPSLGHQVRLRTEVPEKKVVLEPEQWPMLVAVAAGHTVGDVLSALDMREFDGCRAMRSLVESSLVEVSEPTPVEAVVEPEPVVEAALTVESEPVIEPVPAVEPLVPFEAESGFGDEGDTFDGEALRFGVAPESEEPVDAETDDHYAALRAAMVEIGDELVVDDGEPGEPAAPHPVYEFESDSGVDSRAALQALLSEVTASEDEAGYSAYAGEEGSPPAQDEPVDALADRGPWTEHELSAMDSQEGWSEEAADQSGDEQSNIVPFAPVHSQAEAEVAQYEAEADDAEAEAEDDKPSEEPINRGLLLKFLSSVRN